MRSIDSTLTRLATSAALLASTALGLTYCTHSRMVNYEARSTQWINTDGQEQVESFEDYVGHRFSERPMVLAGSRPDGRDDEGGFYNPETNTIFIDPEDCNVTNPLLDWPVSDFYSSFPKCDEQVTHELAHAFNFDLIGKDHVARLRDDKPLVARYLLEGTATYIEEENHPHAEKFRCTTFPRSREEARSDSSVYGCGRQLVTPILDIDLKEGIRYLFDSPPDREDLYNPGSYIQSSRKELADIVRAH